MVIYYLQECFTTDKGTLPEKLESDLWDIYIHIVNPLISNTLDLLKEWTQYFVQKQKENSTVVYTLVIMF